MQHLRVKSGDINLHVIDWRTAHEPRETLFCIHGVTGNARAFDGIAQALAPDIRVVAVDLRGRGESDAPDDGYGIPAHVADMVAVLDGLRLGAVAVAGWSLGSLVGLHLAAAHPECVSRLILLDPPLVPLTPPAQQSLGRVHARLARTYPTMDAALDAARSSPALPREWDAAVEAFARADLEALPDGSVRHRVRPEIVQLERAARVTPLTGVIPNVACPTLILRAPDPLFEEGDQLLTAADAQRAARLLHQARVVDVPGTNHYTITLGAPPGTVAAMRGFLG